ncbi:MAG: hypothetical protein EHM50_09445, partial [Lysobacterales bacterium]
MLTIARFGLAFIVGVATYFFMFWLPFSLLSFLPGHLLFALVGSLAAAIWAARYVWRRTEHGAESGVLALTLGGVLQWLADLWARAFALESLWHGSAVILSVFLLKGIIGLPLDLYRIF